MGLLDDPIGMMMLGGLGGNATPMEAPAGNPFGGSMGGGSSLSRNLMQMRAMRYLREPVARPGRMPSQGRNMGMMGGVQDTPDYSQFTFDPAARAAASTYLGQFGLSPLDPSQVKQNTILPNSGFFGNHPRLSGMLEGGIYGAAASHGADTWGEGIQSVANSLIAGPQMRAAAYNRQFARPFQSAEMLEGLEDRSQKRELTSADIEYRRAATQALKDKPDPVDRFAHFYEDPKGLVHGITESGKDQTFGEVMDKDKGSKNTPGIAPVLRYIRELYGNVDPDTLDKKQWAVVNKKYADEQVKIAATRTGADTEARIRQEYRLGDKVPVDVKASATLAAKGWWDPKNKEIRSSIQKQAVLSGAGKFLSEDEITGHINQHNMEVNERIHKIYDGFAQQINSPMP